MEYLEIILCLAETISNRILVLGWACAVAGKLTLQHSNPALQLPPLKKFDLQSGIHLWSTGA